MRPSDNVIYSTVSVSDMRDLTSAGAHGHGILAAIASFSARAGGTP